MDNIINDNLLINMINNMNQIIVFPTTIPNTFSLPMEDVKLIITSESLKQLPINLYKDVKSEDNTTCLICMDDMLEKDIVRLLPCKHLFHRLCIDKWIKSESYKCPVCRHPSGEHMPYH
jgi:hypothetical protein